MTTRSELEALLERLEGATEGDEWGLIRNLTAALVTHADAGEENVSTRIGRLCDAGGFESAAVALIGRVLPGWGYRIENWPTEGVTATTVQVVPKGLYDRLEGWADAPTPALALCKALVKAKLAEIQP